MQDLRVIGVENGALLVAADDGTRYRIPIDNVLKSKLRQTTTESEGERKVAPREIQAHIRSGMSAEDVASVTGASLDYVQRFEGPVLAEREYVVTSALNVPVHTAIETDPMGEGSTFGSVISERLADLGAEGERWASWKEQGGGWVVKLSFTADSIDHDARWQFDPKKAALAPLNNEAVRLSQQGELSGALIPRLRAVSTDDRVPDTTRFDSGAFTDVDLLPSDTAPYQEPLPFRAGPSSAGPSSAGQPSVTPSAINRDPEAEPAEASHTADLLEALRRRRGEREAASFDDHEDARAAHPSTGSIRIIDVPLDGAGESTLPTAPAQNSPVTPISKPAKKGRATMPSWDDIVFGAKSDDDA